jgi:hypothetical protein
LQLILALAQRYELTIYDPQGANRPSDVREPVDPAIPVLIDELQPPHR